MYGSPMLLVPNSLDLWTEQGMKVIMPPAYRQPAGDVPMNRDRTEPPPPPPSELEAASFDDYVIAKGRRSSASAKVSDNE